MNVYELFREMLAAILFDLDGTLVNTDPIHFKVWQEILKGYGIEMDEIFYKERISGRLNPVLIADILPHLSPDEVTALADSKEAQFRERGADLKPLAGLMEVLKWVEERELKTGLVTNAPRKNVDFMLSALNLTDRFDTVVLGEEAVVGKPDPAPYQLALKRLEITADRAIAFEDSPAGILSAVAAEIYTIGIASTHEPQHLYEFGAHKVIPDFADPALWDLLV